MVRGVPKTFECRVDQPVRSDRTAPAFDLNFDAACRTCHRPPFIENDSVVPLPTERYIHDPADGVVLPRGFVGSPIAPGWSFRHIVPALTERAVRAVHDLAAGDRPFFLLYSMTSPHEPVSPSEVFRGKSGIAPIADFVMETDWSAGQVIQAVDDAGIADNTIVMFTADNGHSHYTGWDELVAAGHMPSGEFRGHKGDIWEGGHRVPLLVRWPGRFQAGTASDQLVSLTDVSTVSYGQTQVVRWTPPAD